MRTGLYLGEIPIGKVVVAVAGENGIQLQEKTVTPSKGDPIEVIPDIGIDGLSKVTVEPIPDAYIDTTTNNAPCTEDMLKGTVAFANTNKIEGALEDKNILKYSADGLSFKDGNLIISGTNTERAIIQADADVSITVEGADLGNATAADVLNGKTFTSENGLVIEGIGPTLANLDAIDSNVLAGKKFIGSNGTEETGTMTNLGGVSATLNSTTKSKTIPAGYTTGGTISLGTNVVDTTISSNAAAASTMLSEKKAYANGSLITGNIATKTSSNLSVSGATVTVPAGYYASQASKSVTTATQAIPSVTSVSSSGVITVSSTQLSGYVSGGTETNTYTLTSSDDSDFKASNIKSGVNIFGVTGSYSAGLRFAYRQDVFAPSPNLSLSNQYRLTLDTENLAGFYFYCNQDIYGESNSSSTNTITSGFVDVRNGVMYYTLSTYYGSTYSGHDTEINLSISSSYLEVGGINSNLTIQDITYDVLAIYNE